MRMDGLSPFKPVFRAIVIGLLLFNFGCQGTTGMAMNRSGMRQYKRGNYAQARHQFAQAIAHNPANPDYRHNLAMALQKQGDPVSAEKIFRHNLTIDAMHQPTYHSLAQNLLVQGRPAEAQDLILGWADTQPYVPEANVELAWIQRETGNTAGSEQALMNALKADPANPTALAHLGQYYQETGRSDQAAAYYQRSLTAKWDQPEVQSRLSTMTEPRNRRRSALIQNQRGSPMMAANPAGADFNQFAENQPNAIGPMVAGGMPFYSDAQAAALEDVSANPRPRRLSRRGDKRDDSVIAAYPLPNFDAPTTAWVPSGTIPGQPSMAYQQYPSYGMTTDMAMTTGSLQPPMIASGPTPIPMSDPAHFTDATPEVTASAPVVDPH